jgi:hypothetical protein
MKTNLEMVRGLFYDAVSFVEVKRIIAYSVKVRILVM